MCYPLLPRSKLSFNIYIAVHNYFAQEFGEHRHRAGEVHPEQWTLNILSQVTCTRSRPGLPCAKADALTDYPSISDAIDDDGSGYISVHEVNQFFKSRPKEWSAVQWLALWVPWTRLFAKVICLLIFSLVGQQDGSRMRSRTFYGDWV